MVPPRQKRERKTDVSSCRSLLLPLSENIRILLFYDLQLNSESRMNGFPLKVINPIRLV